MAQRHEPAFTADVDEDGDVDSADLAQWSGDFGTNALTSQEYEPATSYKCHGCPSRQTAATALAVRRRATT